ncbi:MAG: universal stress protein [Caulobacterales bacterium]
MEIKHIVVFLRAGDPYEARLAVAAALAAQYDAAVAGVCAFAEPVPDIADSYAIGPGAADDVLSHRDAAIALAVAPVEAAFRAAAAERDIDCTWVLSAPDEAPSSLARHARLSDLAVVARPSADTHADHRLAELVALGSGTPCLVAPEGAPPPRAFERVLLAWNGGREAKRALDDGLVFLKHAKTVIVVTVVDGRDEAAEAPSGGPVLAHLARHGVGASLELVEAPDGDAGAALLRHCVAAQADLLIMGAYGHSRAAELVLGGVTRTILARAGLPVLLSH